MISVEGRVRTWMMTYPVLVSAWIVLSLLIAPQLSPHLEPGFLAIGLGLAFALSLGWWDETHLPAGSSEDGAWRRFLNLTIVAASWVFLATAVGTGPQHDYLLHQEFWQVVLDGQDPWYLANTYWGYHPPNAYGPLFNPLALLMYVNRLAPKLLFAMAYIVSATALIKRLAGNRSISWPAFLGLMFWAWNPFAWVEVAIRGHFDILVGLASVAAVHFARERRDRPCAIALAAGVLLKYIPIVLLPFLALDRGKIKAKFTAMSTGLIALGLGLSCLIWGKSTFYPLRFAATRSSSYLSIFRFLRGRYSPIWRLGIEPDVEWLATPLMALALLGAWWWCRSRQVDPATGGFLSILVTLLLYRNGFPQYQMVLIMVASYWVAELWNTRRHQTALAIALVGYFGWINAFALAYYQLGDSSTRFEDAVGLPTFLLGGILLVCLLRSELSSENTKIY